jgi:hypothetical protein
MHWIISTRNLSLVSTRSKINSVRCSTLLSKREIQRLTMIDFLWHLTWSIRFLIVYRDRYILTGHYVCSCFAFAFRKHSRSFPFFSTQFASFHHDIIDIDTTWCFERWSPTIVRTHAQISLQIQFIDHDWLAVIWLDQRAYLWFARMFRACTWKIDLINSTDSN